MKTIKKLWANDFWKMILGFSGLVILFLGLLIQPGMTYFFGDELNVRIFQANARDYNFFGLLEINMLPLDRFDETLQELLLDETVSHWEITEDYDVYAVFDVSQTVSTIKLITIEKPSRDDVSMRVDYLQIVEDVTDETPQNVDVSIDILENSLYSYYLELIEDESRITLDVTVRIRNNHLIVTE